LVGGLTGLAIAIGLVAIGLSGIARGVPALEYVMAILPLLVPALRGLPDAGLVVVYVVWWFAVGAAIGACLGKGKAGRSVAAIAIVVLAVGHVQALAMIHHDLERLAEIFGKLLTGEYTLGK